MLLLIRDVRRSLSLNLLGKRVTRTWRTAVEKSSRMLFVSLVVLIGAVNLNFAYAQSHGTVSGKVRVQQKKWLFGGLKEKKDKSGVIVYLAGFRSEPPAGVKNLVQENEQFHPFVLPIVAGQTVSFPNYDAIYHNVFSLSTVKQFDLGQYRSVDPPKKVTFDRPGLISVYCNIHPEMIAFVLVLENSAFAETDQDGKFFIPKVPPGKYTINAWLPKAKRVGKGVEVIPGEKAEVELQLLEIERIKPHRRKDGSDYPIDRDAMGRYD